MGVFVFGFVAELPHGRAVSLLFTMLFCFDRQQALLLPRGLAEWLLQTPRANQAPGDQSNLV